jgi:hypothetical protein
LMFDANGQFIPELRLSASWCWTGGASSGNHRI